ncbi:hypothetical protein [Paremcibacter congregatus]|uniref:hypothetical protein n=1 Tax=Paremcibacter congregatus TaxID=2043170 RepID=UPI0030EEDF1B|tara:strand:+ start:1274 stop:1693 length:420 start_codon:yes stop_codon:yes gene_type:complete
MSDKPPSRQPNGAGWKFIGLIEAGAGWRHSKGICAISSVAWVNDDHEPERHWEWLISFSVMGRHRVSNKDLKWILKDWDMENFEEDNHEPGIARKFWLAIEERFRKPCPCKDEIIKSEGEYFWSEKVEKNSNPELAENE